MSEPLFGALGFTIAAGEEEDEWIALLGGGSCGAEVGMASDGARRVVLCFPSLGAARRAARRARSLLAARSLDRTASALAVFAIPDEPWVERYQAALRPLPLGDRFLVLPGGVGSALPGRRTIRLAPGRAFGTGEHPTTRLAARGLEHAVAPGSAWLDLGCGTGILAIVAHVCGAGRVVGLDVDPDAIAVAREVLEANDLAGAIELGCGTAAALAGAAWDGIVANISRAVLLDDAGAIAGALRPGGLLLATGFLTGDADDLARGLMQAGLEPGAPEIEDGWALLAARRPADTR